MKPHPQPPHTPDHRSHVAATDVANQHSLPARAWDRNRLMTIASIVLVLAFPAAFFGLEVYLFLGPMLVPSLIALGLIATWNRPWTYLTTGILASLFPLMVLLMFGILEGQLGNPLVAVEYTANALVIFALVLLWSGVIAGYRNARRTGPAAYRAPRDNGVQTLMVLAAAALFIGAASTSFAAENQAADQFGGGYDFTPSASVSVDAIGNTFTPSDITAVQGVITEITVDNKDGEPHTFTYTKDGDLYDHVLPSGQAVSFLVLFDEAGTINYWCTPHSDGPNDDGTGMVGTFTVTS